MNKNKIEYRTGELRAATVAFEVAGRAVTYGAKSSDLGGFREVHLAGVFTRSLASGATDVKCLVNHDANLILGRQANRTLTLTDSPEGLDFVCRLNKDSQQHRDLYASVKSGLMNQCSFAFGVDPDGGDSFSGPDVDGTLTRTVKRANLYDVSIVTAPAFPGGATSVAARSAAVSAPVDVHVQIALWNARQRQRRADARSLFAEYAPLTAEEIVHVKTMGYSEDVILELRGAAYAKQIRQGYTGADFSGGFAANSPRDAFGNGGAAADPTQSLRDDDDDFDDADWWNDDDKQKDDDWDDQRHFRCCQYHRSRAACSATVHNVTENHRCADLHVKAASGGSVDDSRIARVASRKLCLGDIS